jgi:hypothetical protein
MPRSEAELSFVRPVVESAGRDRAYLLDLPQQMESHEQIHLHACPPAKRHEFHEDAGGISSCSVAVATTAGRTTNAVEPTRTRWTVRGRWPTVWNIILRLTTSLTGF